MAKPKCAQYSLHTHTYERGEQHHSKHWTDAQVTFHHLWKANEPQTLTLGKADAQWKQVGASLEKYQPLKRTNKFSLGNGNSF